MSERIVQGRTVDGKEAWKTGFCIKGKLPFVEEIRGLDVRYDLPSRVNIDEGGREGGRRGPMGWWD